MPDMPVRSASLDTDIDAIAAVVNTCDPSSPVTLEQVRSWFASPTPERIQHRLVSTREDGMITGYACVIHAAEAPAGHFYAWVGVKPAFRCQGTGAALWERSLELLRAEGAAQVVTEIDDRDAASLAFAERRGFAIDRHRFHSTLDPESFDEAPYLPMIDALVGQGIRFYTLADFPDTPENNQKYCDLNQAAVLDIPGEDWEASAYPQFFYQHILGAPWFRREAQLLALDSDTWAGFAIVSLHPETRSAYNATTGVIRAYRGRKIAQALKVLATRYARQHGARSISTDNDSLNASMLAINRKMGYQPDTGKYWLVRREKDIF